MKRYPAYKDSGVEWLGEIPEGWEIKRLRYLISRNDGGVWGNDTINDEGDIVLRSTEVNINGSWSIQEPAFRKLSASEKKKALLEFGDILVTKSSGSKEHIGKSAYVDKEIAELKACFSNFMQRLRTIDKYFGKFLYYILNNHIGREQMNFLGQTTTGLINLNGSVLGEIKIAYPSKEDATKLIDFLDQKTTKIDELIKKNGKLIELLKEKRQAVISHAVTKGLNPNANMKDSGIDWIGEIPEGWEVKRLKYVCMINPPKSQYKGNKNIEITFLPMEKVGEQGEINKNETRNFKDVCNGYTYFENSDVLVAKITPCFENGKGCFVQGLPNGIGFGSTEFHVLRANKKIMPEHLYFITYSYPFRKMGEIMLIGAAGQKRVPEDFVKNFSIGIPPLTEQIQILNKLKRELQQIELIITKIQSQNENLKEYRQALISNVVTGKVRVDES